MLTGTLVKEFSQYMFDRYEIVVKKKTGNWLMSIVRVFLGFTKEKWAEFSTKIGKYLYTDMTFGLSASFFGLVRQAGLIVHECAHSTLSWYSYATDRTYRTLEECEGYAGTMFVYHHITGDMIPIEAIIDKLKSYKLDGPNLESARLVLEKHSMTIQCGGFPIEPAKTAARWMDENGVTESIRNFIQTSKIRTSVQAKKQLMNALLK